jgi:hypothetical protein
MPVIATQQRPELVVLSHGFLTHGADCWVMTADRLLSQER